MKPTSFGPDDDDDGGEYPHSLLDETPLFWSPHGSRRSPARASRRRPQDRLVVLSTPRTHAEEGQHEVYRRALEYPASGQPFTATAQAWAEEKAEKEHGTITKLSASMRARRVYREALEELKRAPDTAVENGYPAPTPDELRAHLCDLYADRLVEAFLDYTFASNGGPYPGDELVEILEGE